MMSLVVQVIIRRGLAFVPLALQSRTLNRNLRWCPLNIADPQGSWYNTSQTLSTV
jgi:hypothetical protein